MNKKNILANTLNCLLPDFVFSRVRAFFTNELIVLAYHRVCDVNKINYRFDLELISANLEDFEFQIKYLKKHYNPINIGQLIEHVEKGKSLPRRSVLITFDDGFDDNYTNAFPILKKYNVPATIFISTGYIDTNKIIWFEHLALLIFSLNESVLEISEIGKSYNLGDKLSGRGKVMEKICEDLKVIPNSTREMILVRLQKIYAESCKDVNLSLSKMLTWKQIKEMNESVITFGAHSVTHPVLTMLTDKDLSYELEESKKTLESQLNVQVESLSYPNGNANAFNKTVLDKVKELKYKVAFTYISGCNFLPISNNFTLKRLHIEQYISKRYFKMLLFLPSVFSE